MNSDTRLVHAGRDPERQSGVINPPIYRGSTIVYPTMAAYEARYDRRYTSFGYGIHGTPTTLAPRRGPGRAVRRRADADRVLGARGGDPDPHRRSSGRETTFWWPTRSTARRASSAR